MQLVEHERLEEARVTDARYHLARLVAQGFNAGAQVIWDEHEAWRAATLAAPTTVREPAPAMTWEQALALHRRLVDSGIIPPDHGAN